MSHAKQRKQINCLNCNAVVHGRYCSVCGQENLEPQENAGHLISHFFQDITHFDGKFFSSLKYLIIKPGFLSAEYVAGRRASYLNPVRMYVFTSFAFFLVFFSITGEKREPVKKTAPLSAADSVRLAKADSIDAVKADSVINATVKDTALKAKLKKNTARSRKKNKDVDVDRNLFTSIFSNMEEYRDRKQYDSLVDADKVDDGFITRAIVRKKISLKERYGDDERAMNEKFNETILHSIPQMFFLSLPLFALFLKLLYVRRKQFYYVAHGIFTIHLYIFVYVMVLLTLFTSYLSDLPYMGWMDFVTGILIIYIFYYGYKAMRNFYGQGRLKTLLKYLLIFFWLLVLITVLAIVAFAFSVYKL